MPDEMGTSNKAEMVTECLRRAATKPRGELDVALFERTKSQTLAWVSDGADLPVGGTLAAAGFENMAFREWDESHSASKVLEHAVKNHPDVKFIDGLLVSGVESAPESSRSKERP